MTKAVGLILLVAVLFGCSGSGSQRESAEARPNKADVQKKEHNPSDPALFDGSVPGKPIDEAELDRMEAELEIELPEAYRQFMLARAEELRKYTFPLRGKTELWFDPELFSLEADHLIAENLDQRRPEMAAADTFPEWWKTYFFIGSNGGGDYYGMRLDGTPGVWFLACDGAEIRPNASSLDEFVTMTLENYQDELKLYLRLEELYQQKVRGEVSEEDFQKKWMEILDSN